MGSGSGLYPCHTYIFGLGCTVFAGSGHGGGLRCYIQAWLFSSLYDGAALGCCKAKGFSGRNMLFGVCLGCKAECRSIVCLGNTCSQADVDAVTSVPVCEMVVQVVRPCGPKQPYLAFFGCVTHVWSRGCVSYLSG